MWPSPNNLKRLSDHQKRQFQIATQSRIGILTGGPGTGKSTVIGEVAKELVNNGLTGFVAPTGRAAVRMRETAEEAGLAVTSETIHGALKPGRNGHDGDGWSFQHNASNPLPDKYIVCDEGSMNDAYIFRCLLSACCEGSHLLIVGDPFQLPPVGKGRPLLDMIQSGLIPHGHLEETHRFAGRIADVCDRIKAGKVWQPSSSIDLNKEFPENLLHFPVQESGDIVWRVIELIRQFEQTTDDIMQDMQVIVPVNDKSPLSRVALNRVLQNHLNPHGEQVDATVEYRLGDKVICLRNANRHPCYKDEYGDTQVDTEEQRYVSNGEIGRIRYLTKQRMGVQFEGHHGVLCFERSDWKQDISLAYAITCHKSQGGQCRYVIVIADPYRGARMICNRSWWYTAISRSKEICAIVGPRSVITRDCSVVDAHQRKTFLVPTLFEAVELRKQELLDARRDNSPLHDTCRSERAEAF